jgi:hypothetical protein
MKGIDDRIGKASLRVSRFSVFVGDERNGACTLSEIDSCG